MRVLFKFMTDLYKQGHRSSTYLQLYLVSRNVLHTISNPIRCNILIPKVFIYLDNKTYQEVGRYYKIMMKKHRTFQEPSYNFCSTKILRLSKEKDEHYQANYESAEMGFPLRFPCPFHSEISFIFIRVMSYDNRLVSTLQLCEDFTLIRHVMLS